MTPTLAVNQEYIDAGAADDKDTPLCYGLRDGKPCRNLAAPGKEFCQECDSDL